MSLTRLCDGGEVSAGVLLCGASPAAGALEALPRVPWWWRQVSYHINWLCLPCCSKQMLERKIPCIFHWNYIWLLEKKTFPSNVKITKGSFLKIQVENNFHILTVSKDEVIWDITRTSHIYKTFPLFFLSLTSCLDCLVMFTSQQNVKLWE